MSESVNFDRAASFYDATRKLPGDLADKITSALLSNIRVVGADRVLEIGIGTGRMARPLMREGVRMVGVDISTEMMGQLRAQLTPKHMPPELLLADATALPFRDDAFRAAMIVHVLHLVSSVECVIQEIRRVLAPGGVLLHQTRIGDEDTERSWREHDAFWERMSAKAGFKMRKRAYTQDFRKAFRKVGASLTVTEVAKQDHESSVEQEIDNVRERRHAWMWRIPDDILDGSLGEYELWLRAHGDLGGKLTDRITYVIEEYRWP